MQRREGGDDYPDTCRNSHRDIEHVIDEQGHRCPDGGACTKVVFGHVVGAAAGISGGSLVI